MRLIQLIFPPHIRAQEVELEPIECYGAFCPSADTANSASLTIEQLITMVIGFLTIVAGLAFFIYFLIGGLTWITAGGDKGKVEEAKTRLTNGAIGMIVIVAAYGIVWIVGEVLGINILTPADLLIEMMAGAPVTPHSTPLAGFPGA